MSTVSTDAYEPGTIESVFGDQARTRVFRFLSEHPEQAFEQSEIAEQINVTQPTVSRQKPPLIDSGLVTNTADGLTITDDGIAVAETINERAAWG